MQKNIKRLKSTILKVVISLLLITIVLARVDINGVVFSLSQANIYLYIFSFIILVTGQLISSWRWKILLNAQGYRLSLMSAFRLYLTGFLLSFTLPTIIGGDFYKIYKLNSKQKIKKPTNIILATIMDRALGLYALLIIFTIAIILSPVFLFSQKLLLASISILFTFLATLLFYKPGMLKKIPIFTTVISKTNLFDKIKLSVSLYNNNMSSIKQSLGLSFVFQLLSIFNQYMLFKVLYIKVSISAIFFAIPITKIVQALPISIGGIGVQEVSLFSLLGPHGITLEQITSYSLLKYSMLILLTIIFSGYTLSKNSSFIK